MRLSAWNIFVSRANIRTARAEGKWFALWAYRGDNYSLLPCGVTLSEEQLLSRAEARRRLAEMGLQCTVSDGKERKVYSFSEIQNRRLILFAGAFDNSVKDAALAEAAVADLQKRNSDSSFPLRVGACACSESPLFEGERGSLIELRGFSRSTVNRLMCAADCLLLTSRQEGSPQVIKEAMACGCPIVSVDVGDVRERIERITGCAVANSRDPHELAMLLRMVLNFTPPHIFAAAKCCLGVPYRSTGASVVAGAYQSASGTHAASHLFGTPRALSFVFRSIWFPARLGRVG